MSAEKGVQNSLLLFHATHALGQSKECREVRKQTVWHDNLKYKTFLKNSFESCETVGSMADGIDVPELPSDFSNGEQKLDYDLLYIDKTITVLSINESRTFNNVTGTLKVVLPDKDYPGYVTLHHATLNSDSHLVTDLKSCFSSEDYRSSKINNSYTDIDKSAGIKIDGPAITTPFSYTGLGLGGFSYDHVFCLTYDHLPEEAITWITRVKPYGWPSQEIINTIVSKGCTLAPVGHSDCKYKDKQWRIGIKGEHILFSALNEIQTCCFIILKYFLKYKLCSICNDAISSFHIKNLIFWCSEILPCNWTIDNFSRCLRACVDKLMEFVESKFFPHYFIESRNLLNSKLTDKLKKDILNALQRYKVDVMSVLTLGPFRMIKNMTNFEIGLLKRRTDQTEICICFEYLWATHLLFRCPPESRLWARYKSHDTVECFKIHKDMHQILISNKKSFTVVHRHYVNNMLGMIYYSYYKSNGSIEALKMATKLLNKSSRLEIVTVKLRLATFLYMEKEAIFSLSICEKILENPSKVKTIEEKHQYSRTFTDFVKGLSTCMNDKDSGLIKEYILDLFHRRRQIHWRDLNPKSNEYYFVQVFQKFFNLTFKGMHFQSIYMGAEKWAVPEVILYELLSINSSESVEKPPFIGISIDSIFNCYLLKFLIFCDKNDRKSMAQIISDMKTHAEDLINPLPEEQQSTVSKEEKVHTLNIMGDCCLKARMHREAAQYICRSINISKSECNTAYGYVRCILQIFHSIC